MHNITKYCIKCKQDRTVDILDVLSKGKKQVVCGKCGTIIVTEGEVRNYWYRYYGDDC